MSMAWRSFLLIEIEVMNERKNYWDILLLSYPCHQIYKSEDCSNQWWEFRGEIRIFKPNNNHLRISSIFILAL